MRRHLPRSVHSMLLLRRMAARTQRPPAPVAHARQAAAAAAGAVAAGRHPLAGAAVLITGSSDGIGQHTAEKLAAAGAHVIVHGRNAQRVAAAAERVSAAAAAPGGGGGGGSVTPLVADLASLAGVRQLAAAVREAHPGGIHTLINNAGVYGT